MAADLPEAAWMARALRLAAHGRGQVSPNPLVGAVLVKNGRLLGEGHHRRYGGPHAEVDALNRAKGSVRGGTLYVNLEPCCHWGNTPPCVDAVIAAGIKRVVVAHADPDRRVRGEGLRALKRAGIAVEMGLLEVEAKRLNEAYLCRVTKGRPFVTLKMAMSLDGKTATSTRQSKYLTGEKSRVFVHHLRREQDAVMVGVETVLADDPQLTVRLVSGRDPIRVVVDSQLRTPPTAKVVSAVERQTIIATTRTAPAEKARALEAAGARVLRLPSGRDGRVNPSALLRSIARLGVNSLLVEGGATLAGSLLDKGLVDKVYFFLAPLLLGGACAPGAIAGEGVRHLTQGWRVTGLEMKRRGSDVLLTGYVAKARK